MQFAPQAVAQAHRECGCEPGYETDQSHPSKQPRQGLCKGRKHAPRCGWVSRKSLPGDRERMCEQRHIAERAERMMPSEHTIESAEPCRNRRLAHHQQQAYRDQPAAQPAQPGSRSDQSVRHCGRHHQRRQYREHQYQRNRRHGNLWRETYGFNVQLAIYTLCAFHPVGLT